jgi:glycosyltransferase involved in cell wall biosynthesis
MPEIAIITPMYNAAKTLAETVASGKSQSFTDWEWYLMDDGSSDGTVALARRLADGDPRFKVVENGRVAHIGPLRNRAARQTAAELVTFLDADDVWETEFLSKQRKLLRETDAAVVHSAAWHIVDGKSIEVPLKYTGPRVCEPPEMLHNLSCTNTIYSPSVLMRRDVLLGVGGFSEHPDHFSILDGDLWLKLAPRHRFAFNSERLVHYRTSTTSLSTNPKNALRNSRGDLLAIESALQRESKNLDAGYLQLLQVRLGRAQARHGRLLLAKEEPDLVASQQFYRDAWRNGFKSASSMLFYLAGGLGQRPPLWLHRALERRRERRNLSRSRHRLSASHK